MVRVGNTVHVLVVAGCGPEAGGTDEEAERDGGKHLQPQQEDHAPGGQYQKQVFLFFSVDEGCYHEDFRA